MAMVSFISAWAKLVAVIANRIRESNKFIFFMMFVLFVDTGIIDLPLWLPLLKERGEAGTVILIPGTM
jgi:hypothetical protein